MTSEEIKQEIESLRTESKRALEARAPEIARSYLSEVPLWEIAFQLAARNERPTADREEIRTLWSSDQETGRVWREHAGHLQNELNQARESVRLAVQLKLKAQGELDAANQHVKILQESERRGGPLTVCFDNLTSALRVVLGAYSVDELTRCLDRNHEEFRAILAQAEALRSARA